MRFVVWIAACVALTGCAELFSNAPEIERLEPAPEVFVVDNRSPVRTVSSVKRDRLPGGVVVTAIGVPEVQGFWDAELVSLTEDGPVDGQLVFEFRVAEPALPNPPGTERSREIVAARFISDLQLQGVNRIVVSADNNTRSVRP